MTQYPPGSLLLALAEHIEAVRPDPRFRGAALEAQTTNVKAIGGGRR